MGRTTANARAEAADRMEFERQLWTTGLRRVAGVDEAGRGPLAGPVVAAAVILPPEWAIQGLPPELDGLNDSKQLTESQRERFFAFLVACPVVEHAIASAEAEEIDAINILQATHRAMRTALDQLGTAADHVLVDGTRVPVIREPQTPLVKGDSRSYSIAAASVLAKVTRDRRMKAHDAQWPGYGFAVHKGYPTPAHLAALAAQGPSPIHRRSFGPVRAVQTELNLQPGRPRRDGGPRW
jgi:ribonuclease HII